MRHLLPSVLALSALILPVAAHADTFTGTAAFADTSSGTNNDFQFTGSFATSPFTFTGGVGATYTDQLTITVGDANCTRRNPCGSGATDALSVTVNFTAPNAQSGGFTGTGDYTFYGLYSGSDIDWTNNTKVVSFSDGSSVLLSLPDFTSIQGIFGDYNTENLSIKVLTAPSSNPNVSATPEPSSLMLLGTGVMSLAGVVRRRIAA